MEVSTGYGLRPRNLGELLDLSFRVYRERFALLAVVGIGMSTMKAVGGMAYNIIVFSLIDPMSRSNGVASTSNLYGSLLLGMPILVLSFLVVQGFGSMAVVACAADALFGKPSVLPDLLRRARRRALAAIGTLIVWGGTLLAGAACCCLPFFPLAVVFALAIPIVYLEAKTGSAAMGRSYELVMRRGPTNLSIDSNWVRIIVVAIVTLVVLRLLGVLASAPLLVVSAIGVARGVPPQSTIMGPTFLPLSVHIPLLLAAAIVEGAFLTIGIIPWVLVYYDIRTRYEGLDLEHAIARLEAGGP